MDARGGHHRDEEEEAAAAPLLAGAAPLGYSGHRRSHAGDLHVLSAAFLFVFSAYCAAQNLESSVNTVSVPSRPSSVLVLVLLVVDRSS
jgi:hypothetical protein